MATAAKKIHLPEPRLNREYAFSIQSKNDAPPVLLRFPNVSQPEPEPAKQPPSVSAAKPSAANTICDPILEAAAPLPLAPLPEPNPSSRSSHTSHVHHDSHAHSPEEFVALPASETGIERSWGERVGSKLVLAALLAAIFFGAIVAMRGPSGLENTPPDDYDFSIAGLENATESADLKKTPTTSSAEQAIADNYQFQDSNKAGDSKESQLLANEKPLASQAASQAVTPEAKLSTLELTPPKAPENSEPSAKPDFSADKPAFSQSSDIPSKRDQVSEELSISGPLAASTGPWAPKESMASLEPPAPAAPADAVTNPLASSRPASATVSAPAGKVSYPTTSFPHAVDWQKFLNSANSGTANSAGAPRVANLPQQPSANNQTLAAPPPAYPTTAWPNSPLMGYPATNAIPNNSIPNTGAVPPQNAQPPVTAPTGPVGR